jgi:hypothetical protein
MSLRMDNGQVEGGPKKMMGAWGIRCLPSKEIGSGEDITLGEDIP